MKTNSFIGMLAGWLLAAGASSAAAQSAAPVAARPAGQPVPAQAGTNVIFNALDTDRNGMLSRQEFHAGYPGLVRAIAVELRLREQFQALDADHSGAIEADEFAGLELVKRAGKAAPALARFDSSRDLKLDFAEYLAAVRQLSATPASDKK